MKYVFESGDIVRLKSGSPDLTVESVGCGPWGDETVYVSWFNEDEEYCQASFPHAALVISPNYTSLVDLWKLGKVGEPG